jgi:hypothetical protein
VIILYVVSIWLDLVIANDISQVNSTGLYVQSAIFGCDNDEDGVTQFWIQAGKNSTCDLSWVESTQPLNGLVLQRYIMS